MPRSGDEPAASRGSELEDRVREAIRDELERQATNGEHRLTVRASGEDALLIEGEVSLDELAMSIVGALAGGP
jgi:hypothetical protein